MRYEFGDKTELVVRIVLVAIGGIAFTLFDRSNLGVIWMASYLGSQLAAYICYATAPVDYTRARLVTSVGLYFATTSLFIALPLYLFAFGSAGPAFCGGMALVLGAIFTLWRSEAPDIILPFDIGLGIIISAAILFVFFPQMETMMGRFMAVLLVMALAIYYTMALISSRRVKRQLSEAAERGLEAQKMEALGRLSGGIAHDFNNILTVLQGNLELFEEVSDPAEREKLVREAHVSAQRASTLVRQLLSFARRAPLTPQRVEADEVIEILDAMGKRLLPSSITIEAQAPSVRLPLQVDHDGLMSALLNLIINARDAIDQRGHIRLSAELVTPSPAKKQSLSLSKDTYVAFHVQDDGPGMTPDHIEQALEPFFTTKPVGEGSGLGLPSAKGFAEQSGGALSIRSKPEGTRVTIYVPLADPVSAADAALSD